MWIQNYGVLLCVGVLILVKYVKETERLRGYVAENEQTITQLRSSLAEKEWNNTHLQRSLLTSFYTFWISGPGLSATANYPTHVIVELSDASGQPCSLRQNVTAELQSVDLSLVVPTTVSVRSPTQYKVSYTALSRGQTSSMFDSMALKSGAVPSA